MDEKKNGNAGGGTYTLAERLKRAEAIMTMLEQCYVGSDYRTLERQDLERIDSSLYMIHDELLYALAMLG